MVGMGPRRVHRSVPEHEPPRWADDGTPVCHCTEALGWSQISQGCEFSMMSRARRYGCPIPVVDADSEAVARDWLLEHGYLREGT